MSFLDQLHHGGKNLRKVNTKVTYLDGKQVIVDGSTGETSQVLPRVQGFVVDTSPDDQPAKIRPFLYCGSQDSALPEILEKFEIKEIISLGVEPISKKDDVIYHFYDVTDLPETQLKSIFFSCNHIIKTSVTANRNILVHCNAGVSRSTAICTAYLILEDGLTLEEALKKVKNERTCARPNEGFLAQLKDLNMDKPLVSILNSQ